MKIKYLDTTKEDYFFVNDILSNLKDTNKNFSNIDIDFIDLKDQEITNYNNMINFLLENHDIHNSILLLDYRLQNLILNEKNVLGSDIWRDLKKVNPFLQVYLITSDDEFIENQISKGYYYAYKRDDLEILLEKALTIYKAQIETIKIIEDVIKTNKDEDKVSLSILRLEDYLANLKGDSYFTKIDETGINEEVKFEDLITWMNNTIRKINDGEDDV